MMQGLLAVRRRWNLRLHFSIGRDLEETARTPGVIHREFSQIAL
jgi:hypothetical protein